jgi:ABC-type xylose transport system substrate-binding protein
MGKGKNSRVASSKRVIEEDEEQTLKVIKNKEFLAMRAAASAWLVPVTREEQLKELVDEGLLQEKELADWKVPSEH